MSSSVAFRVILASLTAFCLFGCAETMASRTIDTGLCVRVGVDPKAMTYTVQAVNLGRSDVFIFDTITKDSPNRADFGPGLIAVEDAQGKSLSRNIVSNDIWWSFLYLQNSSFPHPAPLRRLSPGEKISGTFHLQDVLLGIERDSDAVKEHGVDLSRDQNYRVKIKAIIYHTNSDLGMEFDIETGWVWLGR